MIRFIAGLIIVMGSVGGIENAPDANILQLLGITAVGLALMYFGTEKMKAM